MQLSSISDIIGFRIIAPSPNVQVAVLDKLIGSLKSIAGVDNYLEKPRSSGYRATHIRAKVPMFIGENSEQTNFLYEVQVRTVYQHIWATMSESFGENVKITGGRGDVREFLNRLSETIHGYENANEGKFQDETIEYADGMQFVLGVFENGRDPIKYRYGTDVMAAVREMRSKEDRVNANKVELVLLATSANESDLETTHMRYFVNDGIPMIPNRLGFHESRP